MRTWYANIEQHASEGVSKILVGNKCDHNEARVISTEQAQALADQLGVPYIETSAKSNINVEEAFITLARDVKNKRGEAEPATATAAGNSATNGDTVNVAQPGGANSSSGCCS